MLLYYVDLYLGIISNINLYVLKAGALGRKRDGAAYIMPDLVGKMAS